MTPLMLLRREAIVLSLAFLASLPLVTTRLYASDEIEHFAWLRSIAFDRDVSFENEYQYFFDAGIARGAGFHETFLERVNETGKRINYAPIGAAVVWAPFYAAGHVVALAAGAPADGFSQPYISAIAYASAFYGFAAVVLSTLIARRLVGRGLVASLAIFIGTPLVFYAYVAPGFGHAASAFCVSLFVWVWLRARGRWTVRDAILLGLSGGLMTLVREQDVLLVIGPGLDFLIHAVSTVRSADNAGAVRRMLTTALAGTMAFLAGVTPQLLAYKALNGHFGPTSTAASKMSWSSPHGLSVLFSPEHGLLAWTPLVLLAVGGLIAMTRRGPGPASRVALLALLMVAAQAYTSGVVESWTVAGSFGQRRFIALTPLLVVGLAALLATARDPLARGVVTFAMVLCVWWNVGLMAQFGLHTMDRQKLTLIQNARVTFLELPFEAPRIAWRYLTDRSSFYKLRRQ
jgi:hypothetical protein